MLGLQPVPVGTLPAPGVVPRQMHAWVVRKESHGEPLQAFRQELVSTPEPGANEVLVASMAAGLNYNGIWAALGKPISVIDYHRHEFHIAGSDCAGVVWKVGPGVKRWKVGDEVIVHCNQTCGECPACNGSDPMECEQQRIWGYETPYGSFAQFTLVQTQQLLPKPPGMSWEEAASYGLDLFTAYRMLLDRAELKAGETVLVWGGAGGLGVFACQLARMVGALPVAVVSSEERGAVALRFGAVGYINRKNFPQLPFRTGETPEQRKARTEAMKAFGREFMRVVGTQRGPDVVLEHPGQETFPTSVFVAGKMGRIVICGGTTGYELTFDVRHLWMRQKQIIGSHFAHAGQCQRANELVHQGRVKPCLTQVYAYEELPRAHDELMRHCHPGKLACLIGAPRPGLSSRVEPVSPAVGELPGTPRPVALGRH